MAERQGGKMTVYAVPLAECGFVPTGPDNPVSWYLEDQESGRFVPLGVSLIGWKTKEAAEAFARSQGWTVEE